MKLPESTKIKINIYIYINSVSVSHLEITEVVQYIAILLTNTIIKIQKSCIYLFLINHLVNY